MRDPMSPAEWDVKQRLNEVLARENSAAPWCDVDEMQAAATWTWARCLAFANLPLTAMVADYEAFCALELSVHQPKAIYLRLCICSAAFALDANARYMVGLRDTFGRRRGEQRRDALAALPPDQIVVLPYVGLAVKGASTPYGRFNTDELTARKHEDGSRGFLNMLLRCMDHAGILDYEHYRLYIIASVLEPSTPATPEAEARLARKASRLERMFEALSPRWNMNSRPGGLSKADAEPGSDDGAAPADPMVNWSQGQPAPTHGRQAMMSHGPGLMDVHRTHVARRGPNWVPLSQRPRGGPPAMTLAEAIGSPLALALIPGHTHGLRETDDPQRLVPWPHGPLPDGLELSPPNAVPGRSLAAARAAARARGYATL